MLIIYFFVWFLSLTKLVQEESTIWFMNCSCVDYQCNSMLLGKQSIQIAPPCDDRWCFISDITATFVWYCYIQHVNKVNAALCIISESQGIKRPLTLEDYFNDTIRWRSYNLYWISGITSLTQVVLLGKSIYKYSCCVQISNFCCLLSLQTRSICIKQEMGMSCSTMLKHKRSQYIWKIQSL